MALPELKRDIENEARAKVKAVEKETEKEVEKILKEAKAESEKIISKAKEEANKEAKAKLAEGKAEIGMEIESVINAAKTEAIDTHFNVFKKKLSVELSKHMQEIAKNAIKQFRNVVGDEEVFVETNKKNALMMKGVKNVKYADIEGFTLYTSDKKISLHVSVDRLISDREHELKSIMAAHVFK